MIKKLPENKLRSNTSSLVRIGDRFIKIAAKQKGKDYNSIGSFIEAAISEKATPTWIDAEAKRPNSGQDIIFEDAVGMYRGTYNSIKSGQVVVENGKETVEWESIYQWIPYPQS